MIKIYHCQHCGKGFQVPEASHLNKDGEPCIGHIERDYTLNAQEQLVYTLAWTITHQQNAHLGSAEPAGSLADKAAETSLLSFQRKHISDGLALTSLPDKSKSIHESVTEFHQVMDIPILDKPQVPSDERVRLRAKLIVEETLEFLEACFVQKGGSTIDYVRDILDKFINDRIGDMSTQVSVNLTDAADALVDIAYVVEGSNLEFGINSHETLAEVHAANMRKVDGPTREDGKRLKPEGWQPPNIAKVLVTQGWKPDQRSVR